MHYVLNPQSCEQFGVRGAYYWLLFINSGGM